MSMLSRRLHVQRHTKNQTVSSHFSRLALIVSLMTISGCGSSGQVKETLVPVTGSVTLDGKPTEGIRLSFVPMSGTKAVGGCWATTDDQGQFTVQHISKKEGIPVGQYHVLLSRRVKADGSVLGPDESPTMVQSQESISPMYSDPGRAGKHNEVIVTEKGATNVNLKVTSAPKGNKKR